MMDTANGATDLTGKLLIAMPGMGDPRFEHSVVYMCAHSDEGAMGLIINKPSGDVTMAALLDQLSITAEPGLDLKHVHFGGPVEMGRGFVLHSPDYMSGLTTLQVDPRFSMTGTLDVLETIARGEGPAHWLAMLGYAGWGPGQLEAELTALLGEPAASGGRRGQVDALLRAHLGTGRGQSSFFDSRFSVLL